ncbi:MAG: family 20 glycosylhydrolase [Phocaeicola sp.]
MMKRHFLLSLLVILFQSVAAQKQQPPQVIPALQEWKGETGKLQLPTSGRIVVNPENFDTLKESAHILAADLKELLGWNYQVVSGKSERGAIHLSIKEATREEQYELHIRNSVEIKGASSKGLFWGTRTLLQMLHNQPQGIQKGRAIDYPAYANRGFMIDVARKFFTIDYLRDYIKILSFYKMNELQIHLNDNGFVEFFDNDWSKTYAAFRLESDRFPGLTAKDGHYTKQEFKELQQMGARYRVNVIPEIDAPAHSLAFTHYNPRLAADNEAYGMDHLDLYKPEVYEFLDTLFDEYLGGDDPVFVGPDVHIGTDEYNRKESEQFRYFTNYYLNYVEKYGKNPRLWGSLDHMKGETPVDLNGKVVNAWNSGWMDMETILQMGGKVINTCDAYLYIVPAAHYYYDYLNGKRLYESWNPRITNGGREVEASEGILGAMFAVWNDKVGNGISQQDVHHRSFPALQVMSQILWKEENRKSELYEQFATLCKQMPEAPGVNLLGKVKQAGTLFTAEEEILLQGAEHVISPVACIGYPYRVEFELQMDSVPAINGILFKDRFSQFITNWQNSGKFAFKRDGYEFVFHNYRLPKEEWIEVAIEGDHQGTSLYINGELQERLEGRIEEMYNAKRERKDKIWHQETLVFPLQQLGDEWMGFKGKIREIKYNPTSHLPIVQ